MRAVYGFITSHIVGVSIHCLFWHTGCFVSYWYRTSCTRKVSRGPKTIPLISSVLGLVGRSHGLSQAKSFFFHSSVISYCKVVAKLTLLLPPPSCIAKSGGGVIILGMLINLVFIPNVISPSCRRLLRETDN